MRIDNSEKKAHDQYIIATDQFKPIDAYTFPSSRWYSIHDSIWDKNNWKLIAEDDILK